MPVFVEHRLGVGEVCQPGAGCGDVRELNREVVADVPHGQARARTVGESGAKLPARPTEEFAGLQDNVETEEAVLGNAPPPPADHVTEWVDEKKEGRLDTLSREL